MKKLVLGAAILLSAACSDNDSKNLQTEHVQINLNAGTALQVADTFCTQKNLPESTLGHVFASYGAAGLDSCSGAVKTSTQGATLSLEYTDFCFNQGDTQITFDGSAAVTLSLDSFGFEVTGLRVITDSQDLTIDGSMILSTNDEAKFSMNLSVLNNESGKLFKLENITAGSKSFADLTDLLKQLESFDGNLSFTSALNYSGSIFYSDIGQFDFAYENDKTILIGEDGARLEFLSDQSVVFHPLSGDAQILQTGCP